MSLRIVISAIFLPTAMALFATSGWAQSTKSGESIRPLPRELALTYNWARSNTPPGGCGCFSLNGASIQLAWPVHNSSFALTANLAVVAQPNALFAGNSLTLGTLLGGAQFRPFKTRHSWQPFAEILVGGSRASGKMLGSSGSADGADLAFAAEAGGGLDLRVSHRWLWRVVQVDYMADMINNGSNNRQNILRVNSGLALRF